MRQFLFSLPRDIAGCFKGWKIIWHFVAIGLAVVIVASGFDWFYFGVTRSPQLLTWLLPATIIGVEVPLLLPPLLLLAGMVFKRAAVTRTGWALAQAALIGLVLTEFLKVFTGRPRPPYHMVFVKSEATRVFHFGLLPGWNFSPDNVTEADTSHVFHFGLLRGGLVNGWPSTHVAVAFAMAITLFVLFRHKRWLGAAALLYALYIGFGVSMSIHWLSDCVSGAVFGTIIGTTVGRSFATIELKDEADEAPALTVSEIASQRTKK